MKKLEEQHMETFQVAKWRVKTKSESLLVIVIYHPPFSTTNQTTNSAFLYEFIDWITTDQAHEKKIFITGNFNIHINNSDTDDDASTFLETIKAMDLQQHINFDTHRKGNTLDLILTESYSQIIIKSCTQGSLLSDHCVVLCQTSIEREDIETKSVTYRNLKDLDRQAFEDEMRTEYPDNQKLYELIRSFESNLKDALGKVAPGKTKKITSRRKQPCFGEQLKSQKQCIRRREKIWKKCRLESNWKAVKIEPRKYRDMLREAKIEMVSNLVLECGRDTKKLYKVINGHQNKKFRRLTTREVKKIIMKIQSHVRVTPSGLELIHSNYRPVSNLPFLSKCQELCSLTQHNDHCRKHNLMLDCQSVYKEHYSCETMLIQILDDLLWSMKLMKLQN